MKKKDIKLYKQYKRGISLALAAVLSLGGMFVQDNAANAAGNDAVKIQVDTDHVVREMPAEMFGVNHRYHFDGVSSWDAENNCAFEGFDVIARQSSYGSIRYPGGAVSNTFQWKRSIGPKRERIPTIHGAANYSQTEPIIPNFGLDEAAGYICDDLGSNMIYVYGMARGSAADAADLVEYLNAEVGADPNGDGVDWAAVRAQNGHEKPYGIRNFEIGNEFGIWGQEYWCAGRAGSRSFEDAYLNGGTMTFSDQQAVEESDWRTAAGRSNGAASQVKFTKYFPVTPSSVVVKVNGTAWSRAATLEGAGAANVYTVDGSSGKITFGNGQNGNIPANGSGYRGCY